MCICKTLGASKILSVDFVSTKLDEAQVGLDDAQTFAVTAEKIDEVAYGNNLWQWHS